MGIGTALLLGGRTLCVVEAELKVQRIGILWGTEGDILRLPVESGDADFLNAETEYSQCFY